SLATFTLVNILVTGERRADLLKGVEGKLWLNGKQLPGDPVCLFQLWNVSTLICIAATLLRNHPGCTVRWNPEMALQERMKDDTDHMVMY
ncbi:unnamed protein product, partial [Caretta caretta]